MQDISPLSVIINPPGIQYGMPGDIVSLYAVVINEGDQSAVIDLFFSFDETFQKVSGWSASPRASLAVAPKESSDEVTFDFEIPADALAGTYDYTFVVDSPEHYPQDTPINFPGQLKVLLKEQTVIRASDPTFSIIPATNPNKPLNYRPGEPLKVVVKVENRSNRVDRFRLTCPDLDDKWFKISYPGSGVESVGLFDISALELNPNTEGEINLEFRPPVDTLAGSYSPTIRLISENNPDLILLDLIYINIPNDYQIGVELNTILGRVSRKPGKYELVLNNRGNLIRELLFNAKSRDEEELCDYKFEPREIKLLPDKTQEAILTVKPRHWWRRPLFGQPLQINFQVNVTDQQSYPLAGASPQASLLWQARPWWQLLLLILLGVGLFAGAAYVIWRILHPDPLTIEYLTANDSTLLEGDEIKLNWRINNFQRLETLQVTTTQPNQKVLRDLNKKSIYEELIKTQNPPCNLIQEDLVCKEVPTGIKTAGKYAFEIKASYIQNSSFFNRKVVFSPSQKTPNVIEIAQKPIATVVEFKTNKQQYQKGEKINLTWKMTQPESVSKATIYLKNTDTLDVMKPINIKFRDENGKEITEQETKKICKPTQADVKYNCSTDIIFNKIGIFIPKIKVETLGISDRNSQANTKIEILPKPSEIVFFKINNRDQPLNVQLNEGETVTLSWKVEGENIQVKLEPYGDVKQSDTKQLPVFLNFPSQVTLKVIDKSGKQQQPPEKTFVITVKPKPTPAPSPVNPNLAIPSPTTNPFIRRP